MKMYKIIPYFYVGLIFTFITSFCACLVMVLTGEKQSFSDIIAVLGIISSLILLYLIITNRI